MLDILPKHIIDHLSDRYIAGVANAESSFADSSADEDSVTGALGQAISMSPVYFSSPQGEFAVRIYYKKIRGRGPGAPEKALGADGIFQISVTDKTGKVIRQKGLPFQSKVNWTGTDGKLARQALEMERMTDGGLVIDYSTNGYKACPSKAVVLSQGNRKVLDEEQKMRPLGQILGHDFLDCSIGVKGLYFDPLTEQIIKKEEEIPAHAITTEIMVLKSSRQAKM